MASWRDHQILSAKSDYNTERALPPPADGGDFSRLGQAVRTCIASWLCSAARLIWGHGWGELANRKIKVARSIIYREIRETKKAGGQQKRNTKMTNVNPAISMAALNMNGVNTQVEKALMIRLDE